MSQKKNLKLRGQSKELEVRFYTDEKTGEKFVVDKYPENQTDRYSAHYAVSDDYGKFIGKTRTLKGAKELIVEQRNKKKMKDVS